MNRKDLDSLNELYLSVYDGEQLNEAPVTGFRPVDRLLQGTQAFFQGNPRPTGTVDRQIQTAQNYRDAGGVGVPPPNWKPGQPTKIVAKSKPPKPTEKPVKPTENPQPQQRQQTSTIPARSTTAPVSSGTPKVAPAKSATSAGPIKPAGSPMDQWRAANPKLAAAADEKARIRGTQQTDNPLMKDMKSRLPMNSPSVQSPAVAKLANKPTTLAGNQSLVNNPNAIKAAPLKPATPGSNSINNTKTNPTIMKQSYEWPSAKTIRDIAGAYSSIYEAKKKVDQDQDGDNDFADVRIARMVASGVPKAKAIAMVKDKSYNEEVELWVNELLEEGYDLSDYTWDEMAEIYLDEATAMAKRGYDETEIRNRIAKSTGGGDAADRATALANKETFGRGNKAARQKYAATQRGDFRDTTSSNSGLHGYAHKSNDPAVKAKQAARGAQRSALTPREKKQLNREAYETYEFVASYLLENNFAESVEDANAIINNMSEGWFESIMEEKKPLPVAKMKRKEEKLDRELESELPKALRTEIDSPERKELLRKNRRFGDMHDVRRSVSTRGGKRPLQMPEVGRYKPKDED